ncbi:universal stress protein [Ramlibacter sp. AN1015]|uniref:universal stress protein n=1 Tax=Ramlibacter sp. AN1015 TaxID=3133428 RepID=UPI0030BE1613
MKQYRSLLLPLDGSPEAAKAVGCALWLAGQLGATLHVLHATAHVLPGDEAIARLRLPQAARAQVVVHQLAADAKTAVLDAVRAHDVELVVMSARGASASAGAPVGERLGGVARAVIEACPVPVVLLPVRYREALPWHVMLAAASGEPAADRALEAAAQLAAALALRVEVMHAGNGPVGTAGYADAAHHEYGRQLQEMVQQGLAGCTADESRSVREVLLRPGDPAAALLEHVERKGTSLLALGWHGALGGGRASVLKRLLEEAPCALLLARTPESSPARLKVGEDLDA